MSGELARIAVALNRDHFSPVPVSWSSALVVNRGRACFSDKASGWSSVERQQCCQLHWQAENRRKPVRSWDETRTMMAAQVLDVSEEDFRTWRLSWIGAVWIINGMARMQWAADAVGG